jgi:hypothetical protein
VTRVILGLSIMFAAQPSVGKFAFTEFQCHTAATAAGILGPVPALKGSTLAKKLKGGDPALPPRQRKSNKKLAAPCSKFALGRAQRPAAKPHSRETTNKNQRRRK